MIIILILLRSQIEWWSEEETPEHAARSHPSIPLPRFPFLPFFQKRTIIVKRARFNESHIMYCTTTTTTYTLYTRSLLSVSSCLHNPHDTSEPLTSNMSGQDDLLTQCLPTCKPRKRKADGLTDVSAPFSHMSLE